MARVCGPLLAFAISVLTACAGGEGGEGDTALTFSDAICGNGNIEDGEECDEGDANANNASCTSDCRLAVCGDGLVNEGVEQCDDGNEDNTDSCINTCMPASCGDGFLLSGVEQCDDGNDSNADACLGNCLPASCGDGFTWVGNEQCDNGEENNDENGPCRADCTTCACQGSDVGNQSCVDEGFDCGPLACDGCNFDTSACQMIANAPAFEGQPQGPDFRDSCFFQCTGWIDTLNPDDIPDGFGDACALEDYDQVRVVCGSSDEFYRYLDIDKNVFRVGIDSSPEEGLILDGADQDGEPFLYQNTVHANNLDLSDGTIWFGGPDACSNNNNNTTINNQACTWEVSNCYGQGLNGERRLFIYVHE